MWYLYLLYNEDTQRTYIGCSTDPHRRLRQHRREIIGGAKATAKSCKHWTLKLIMSGFTSKSEVMRWEKIIKSRCRGFAGRVGGFKVTSMGRCPQGNKPHWPQYVPPTGLKLEIVNDNRS